MLTQMPEEEPVGGSAKPSDTEPSPDYSKCSVLVADDQESIRVLVERVMGSRLGCPITLASNGEEAVALLEERSFDVFITDMMMPGLHGLELIRHVHAKYPETDIVVMTGYPMEFPYVEVMHAGARDFLNKPFPHAEFEAKLIRLFRERDLLREQKMAESKYRSLFDRSGDGMLLLNEAGFLIRDANFAFQGICGCGMEQLAGRPVFELFAPNDRLRLEQWMKICLRSGGGTMADLTMAETGDQQRYVDLTAAFIETGYERVVFVTFKDITEKREFERQLAEAAEKDELTGLFNKRSFQNRIAWATDRAKENAEPLTLLMVDLDNFKACNDTYGHQVGDEVLIAVGKVITKSIRAIATDEGFRCGGDEFIVILHEAGVDSGRVVAERMQAEFGNIEARGTTMSIGVAEYREDMGVDGFVRAADKALYKAKASGKNTIETAS